ncbi:peptidase inhibitor family I36 protein [Actinosynnema sp. CS-041913]|uniref:peptidase inhibitor family I36 protein n=1 Tax=Actinosynnema sp. CS-041913 TaxID=3239917 RepID=UPI003D91F536
MRWLKGLTAALGFVAATALVAPAAAHATPLDTPVSVASWEQCLDGYFCVWEYPNGNAGVIGGHFARFAWGSENLANPIGGFVFNDKISSVWNRTGKVWCTHVDKEYQGRVWPVGNWRGNTAQYSMDNKISSLRVCP